ncbi:SDR family oxidoreductase [Nonomuraea pusilla]|uniref:NAD(P)-dependent dehydrogenase, short-chain alcohol dehydrogenase family n=1 Tax=Nonomuraea pusilla TaxID=46177 RepID=A0A1H7RXY6_9ACTN|nr:SDR family oxidoreductase [Nonomuraea pusilla]SEL64247.1 NAD(P)-dependent dehydrogenase, short-chain alcohol dehydrogenase family [Nonomuraea pusilla]
MTLFSVEGKTVVVTGGSRGIGRMIAAGFAAAGATVYISARRAAELGKTAAELGCRAVPADLSTPEGVSALVEAVDGPVHVLVNNAGATWGAPLEEFPEHAFDKLWDINVKGVFFLTQKFLPRLREAATPDDPARVITIGSVDGIRVPDLPTYAYSSTKAAVHILTRHLARHLAEENITVNAIAPGPFESKMMAFALDDPETRRAVASHVPLGRIGRPDDMAGTAIYLSSRAGAYLTGAVIPVDGGITA